MRTLTLLEERLLELEASVLLVAGLCVSLRAWLCPVTVWVGTLRLGRDQA